MIYDTEVCVDGQFVASQVERKVADRKWDSHLQNWISHRFPYGFSHCILSKFEYPRYPRCFLGLWLSSIP